MNNNDKIFFELKLKIAKALMYGINVKEFLEQLITIENQLGNFFKAEKLQEFYFNRIFIKSNKKIAVSMIVKDEEDILEATLQNVSIFADEIVIVDTGSKDNTISIAKKYTDKIFTLEWNNDFSYARNYSLDKCDSDWILYLDADETLDEKSIPIIKDQIGKTKNNEGLLITKIINIKENNKENYIGYYPRLFLNIGFPLLHFFGKIHEQIAPSLINFGFEMVKSDIEIIHQGYNISNEDLAKKVKRNLEILASHIQEEPTNGYTWYQLGNTLFQMNEYSQCIEILDNALKCNNLTPFLSSNTALAIANSYYKLNEIDNAIKYCKQSIKYNPKNQVSNILLTKLLNLE